jgi:hypothetical protein
MGTISALLTGRGAVWLLVALLVQAAALLLAEAGPSVRYQHYPVYGDLISIRGAVLIGVLGLQAILVVLAFRRHLGPLVTWARTVFRPWQLILAFAVFVVTSSAPSRSLLQYAYELVLASGIQILGLAAVLLFASGSSKDSAGRRISTGLDRLLNASEGRGGLDRLTVLTACWVVFTATLLGRFSYEWYPHIPDEIAYIIQSRYMALGWLTAPTVPVHDAFLPEMMIVSGDRWYSIFPPGWPALLAIGQFLRVPMLVNPLLGGACVVLTRLLIGETHGRATARLSVLRTGAQRTGHLDGPRR